MKRFMSVLMALGLVVGAVASAEAKGINRKYVERTVKGSYGPFPAPVTGCNDPLGPWACVIVPTRTAESFFTAKVTDAHGQPVFVEVVAYTAWGSQHVTTFCGETTESIEFPQGTDLAFFVGLPLWPTSSLDCPTNRIKTTGTISVTLSNLP